MERTAIMKRKIDQYLNNWLKRNTVLLIDGMRQVGKSYSIREFGRKTFGDNLFEFNFDEHKKDIQYFNNISTAKELITSLSLYSSKPFVPGKTLIFLDEIQLVTGIDWEMMAKYLIIDGRFRFIYSGSLLGVLLNGLGSSPNVFKKDGSASSLSHPGGYLDEIRMFPMDFEEYLWANGLADETISILKDSFINKKEISPLMHKKILDYFYEYLFVGGLPDAVNSYLKGKDVQELNLAHQRIDKMFIRDITQYAEANKRIHLLDIYQAISSQINTKNKRFITSKILKNGEKYEISDDFRWLIHAGLAYPVYNVTEPTNPLRLSEKRNLVKLFEGDTGMLTYHLLDTESIRKLLSKEADINYGAIFENVAAQLFETHGFDHQWYYDNKKHGEMDFIINYKGAVVPIEIKSGKTYKEHSALTYFMSKDSPYHFLEAFIFSNGNYEIQGNINYLPIYLLEFLRKE